VTFAGRHQRGAEIARALAALLVLAALIVGIPALLLVVAPALDWPTLSRQAISSALTRPDDGHLLLTALTLVGWAAWAVFAVSVVVETVAMLRGLPTPRLPLVGAPQKLAASLVASAAMLLAAPTGTAPGQAPPVPAAAADPAPTGSMASTPIPDSVPATARTAAQPTAAATSPRPRAGHGEARPSASSTSVHALAHDQVQAARAARARTITVVRGDTLWDLAATHLGDGARFREIARLNYGRPQPDGRTLTDTHWIYPGWVLLLPEPHTAAPDTAHAPKPTPRPTTRNGRSQHRTYVVQRGDTLWDIAAQHLGDPLRYREIFRLNRDRTQPDGQHLDDPRLIQPGWTLLLPARHGADPAPGTAPTTPPRTPATPPVDEPDGRAPAVPGPTTPRAVTAPPHRTPAPEPHRAAAATPAPPGPSAQQTATPAGEAEAGDAISRSWSQLVLGLTALTATGFLAELARRRRRQQQQRRPGQRLPLPIGDPAAAERLLRSAQIPITLDTVASALQQMADGCRTTGRPLPRLVAVLVGQHQVDIIVEVPRVDASAGDEPPPAAPFALAPAQEAPVGDNLVVWRLDPNALDTAPGEDRARSTSGIAAYPALVALGTAGDGMLLLNLEAAGTLELTGDDDAAAAVLRTLGVELATSPLSAASTLILTDHLRDLADVADPDRVAAVDDTAAARRADVRLATVRHALDADDLPDLHDARSTGRAPDHWAPEVHLGHQNGIAPAPWTGVVAVTTASASRRSATGWTLDVHADGAAVLEPLGLHLAASRLTDTDYESLLALLDAANQPPEYLTEDAPGSAQPATGTPIQIGEPDEPEEGDDVESLIEQLISAAPLALRSPRAAVIAALPKPPIEDDEPDLEPDPDAPRILLLGRVDLEGASTPATARRGRSLELLAYLALHPGASASELDDALWPGQRVTYDMRNSLISRTRTWLGTDRDGRPYLDHSNNSGRGYRLHPAVRTDWHDLLRLARQGLTEDDVDQLDAALRLVRGRPFLGVDPAGYAWAEADAQTMISTIVDIAHDTAAQLMDTGMPSAARSALATGLTVEPANEALAFQAMRLAARTGDRNELQRLAQRLREQLRAIDPDATLDASVSALLTTGT
jgi:nucleoid-associated protein YgaU/DNA-binding SARP family transcriptional activator